MGRLPKIRPHFHPEAHKLLIIQRIIENDRARDPKWREELIQNLSRGITMLMNPREREVVIQKIPPHQPTRKSA